ncbi:MAG: GntR family transcriptional regulator [Phycisphaerales bacterium]|jgi:LacI family transcriptional regulator|nr:GntR family transcriptional regulator [Phycisphaerales bacterium]
MERETIAISVASRLEQQLHSLIAEGRLAGGERLPSVRELTHQYGISRNTVQAALRGLAARGLVRSVPRQGTVVLPRDGSITSTKPTRKANQIGVIDLLSSFRFDDEDTASWFQGVIRGAELIFARSNYHLVKAVYLQQESHWIRKLWQRIDGMADGMAGVILFADIATDEMLSGLDSRNIPWVTIGRRNLRSVHNFIAMDHLSTSQLIGWTFARLGYDSVLYLGWDYTDYFKSTGVPQKPDEKFLGLVQGYIDGGGDPSRIALLRCPKHSADVGYEQTCRYIDQHGAPRGVFSFNDHLSMGAMKALQDRGINVPHDAGVVGSMGLSAGQYSNPPLTVASQPISEMGQQVAHLLLEMIRGEVARVSGRFISYELIFRQSLALPENLKSEVLERQSSQRTLLMKTGL